MDAKEVVSPCRRHKPLASSQLQHQLLFFHISCPLLHNLVVLDWQVMEFCQITFLGPKKQEDHLGDSLSCDTFNAQDTCRASVSPISDEGVVSSFARFSFLYIAHLPHFLHFTFADFWERKPIAFDFVNSSFTSVTLSVVSLKVFL